MDPSSYALSGVVTVLSVNARSPLAARVIKNTAEDEPPNDFVALLQFVFHHLCDDPTILRENVRTSCTEKRPRTDGEGFVGSFEIA